ncbi:MAG: DUF6760 family protein [Bacillota bacterium]
MKGYPLDRLYEEVAFVAYYFNWSHTEIMNMEHRERRRWCEEISEINKKISGGQPKNIFEID